MQFLKGVQQTQNNSYLIIKGKLTYNQICESKPEKVNVQYINIYKYIYKFSLDFYYHHHNL